MTSLQTQRLREARESRGLTQRELARLCNMGENQINKYENGGGEPSVASLKLIARELGVSTDYLLGLSDDPGKVAEDSLREDERKLLAAYSVGDVTTLVKLATDRLRLLEGQNAEG